MRPAVAIAVAFLASACGKSKKAEAPPPEVTGLAAVPASAEAVIGIDLPKLVDAPLVGRVVDQLFLHDTTLATRWQQVRDTCKLDLGKQVKHLLLALGPHQTSPGTGPVLLIATGTFVEADVAGCIRTVVGKGGGTLTATTADGRTIYTAKEGNRQMVFAFGRADTLVLGSNEAYVKEAMSLTGPKISGDADMKAWLAMIDQNAPLWGVGRVDPQVGGGLVKRVGGLVAGPRAIVGTLDPTGGAKVDAGIVMASPADANQLESFTKTQLGQLTAAASLVKAGGAVGKIETTVSGDVVHLGAAFTVDDLNQLLSALDGGDTPKQDAPSKSP
jgi:hypothetical protein